MLEIKLRCIQLTRARCEEQNADANRLSTAARFRRSKLSSRGRLHRLTTRTTAHLEAGARVS